MSFDKVVEAILKNAGIIPVEIELYQEIAALKELLGSVSDESEIGNRHKLLKEKQLQFNLLLERANDKLEEYDLC